MRTLLILTVSVCAATMPTLAADWPQWRGPDRTDRSTETGLLKTWPQSGPPLIWTYAEAGVGYSGPAIVGDRLYAMGAEDQTEYVYALDIGSRTPKKVWSAAVGPIYQEGHGDGPRGTPTVDGDLLYAIGGKGNLVCVETATGKIRWQQSLPRDLGGRQPYWGYTESPLIDGEKVLCTPGGPQGTIAALNKKTGEKIWQTAKLTDPAGYASMIAAEVGGLRQYIQTTMKGVAGVAADDGRLLWHYLEPAFRTAVIPTPIFHHDFVYVSSGYGAGCDLLHLIPDGPKGTKAEKVYANKNMVNHHGGVVLVGEYLYGYSDGKGWVCQEFKTGKNVWEEKRKLGKGSITYADGRLYCYSEADGTLVLIDASPDGWKEDGRFKIPRESTRRGPSGRVWTHPVIAHGQLYLRDQELLFCFDVKDHALGAE
ncbi:MAG TPA: PQQ-binding-like beta-propeller repeat protein [Gemmataceae bacterium]|nr:PQQ-binding-like beta-propeller repeat protein [Gemmataceae bacterium]